MGPEFERMLEHKPGWLSRIFGIEVGNLIACDATWDGDSFQRGSSFCFLFRSRRAKYFVLETPDRWRLVDATSARELYSGLPLRLASEEEAFAAPELPTRATDDSEDRDTYHVVRNEQWDFSIWLDDVELPSGWTKLGVTGSRQECLDFIDRECVFGVPSPESDAKAM